MGNDLISEADFIRVNDKLPQNALKKMNIPVGISDFEKIRKNGYYYVDKSGLIEEILQEKSTEVTLITRPRRFGKTLGMSMLESFFSIQKDSRKLFEGLKIWEQEQLCETWMNQWPTVFLSFKRVDGLDFGGAYGMLTRVLAGAYKEHLYLLDSNRVNEYDKRIISRMMEGTASVEEVKDGLLILTGALCAHYGKPVILLIDEYDVPMAKANSHGYYREMVDVMKGLLQALKDNTALSFAIVTGCLKIAKESIFTGTNNFVSDTISDSRLNEYFGFTQKEVDLILKDADAVKYAGKIREWYDGYHFGSFDVYCPWDVMNYLVDLQRNPNALPVSYWKNTSDNAVIRSFLDYAGNSITKKMETLLDGGYIVQRIDENLTYDYLHSSEDNLWSILYLTGYLTRVPDGELQLDLPPDVFGLRIPNAEIREIFEATVKMWFDDNAKTWNRQILFNAIWSGDCEEITREMNRLMRRTISYHDYREDFYHAFLAGIFTGAGYMVESNKEHGEGRSDVVVYDPVSGKAAVFEAKYSKVPEDMERDCERALVQIEEKMYAKELADDYEEVLCYGIAFFRKRCLVKRKR